jgi:hypothetical protein
MRTTIKAVWNTPILQMASEICSYPTTCSMEVKMKIKIFATMLVAAHLTASPPAVGQTTNEDEAVLATALVYWRDQLRVLQRLPDGTIKLDPRVWGETKHGHNTALVVQRNPNVTRSLARVMGAVVAPIESVLRCSTPGDFSTCELEGAVALISASAPSFHGDTAVVSMRSWFEVEWIRPGTTPPPGFQSVAESVTDIVLARERDGWRVVRLVGRSIS